jgi:PAS domain S-box-containing protein
MPRKSRARKTPPVADEVRQQNEVLQKIFDHIPIMINFLDARGELKLVNREWERTLGWTLAEAKRTKVDLYAAFYPDPDERQRARQCVADASGEAMDFRTTRRDGRMIDTTWTLVRLSDGTTIGFGQDVTERKRAQEALHTFSRQLLEVQEAERRHIARELHDEIGQLLTGLTLLLETGARASVDAVRTHLSQAHTMAKDLLARIRDLSLDLRPPMLDDLGLLPALLWYFERFSTMTGVNVAFTHAALEQRFTPEIETAVYRIVQEALTNVARHAGVREVAVSVAAKDNVLSVKVEDRGRGFDPDAIMRGTASSGLIGMRERARLLNGRFVVHSGPDGTGTRLTAEVPLTPLEPWPTTGPARKIAGRAA